MIGFHSISFIFFIILTITSSLQYKSLLNNNNRLVLHNSKVDKDALLETTRIQLSSISLKKAMIDLNNNRQLLPDQAKLYVEKILEFEKDYPLNKKSWLRVLEGCFRRNFGKHAIMVANRMLEREYLCSSHDMTLLLTLACSGNLYEEGLSLFDRSVLRGLEPTVHNFSPLLKTCGSVTKACELFMRMEFANLTPNVISYTAAIKSCEVTGDWQSAIELLELMRAHWIPPNERTYCCVISAASKGYAGTIAVNILREMQHYGCPPNPICYGGALTACARCGMWDQVEFLLNEMISLGLPLQESILISVINVCRMSAISNSPMYNTNITTSLPMSSSHITSAVPSLPSSSSSSQNLKDWTRAVWLVDKWAPLTANLTESLFTMAMDCCETENKHEEVLSLYSKMLALGVYPSRSTTVYISRALTKFQGPEQAVAVFQESLNYFISSPRKISAKNFIVPIFNMTNALCINSKRYDLLIDSLKTILLFQSNSSNSLSHNNTIVSSAVVKEIIQQSLVQLTLNFSSVYIKNENGKILPSKDMVPFLNSLSECLSFVSKDEAIVFSSDSYPIASKLLLDNNDYESLRLLLNRTLYTNDINSTRLYDFTLKNLCRITQSSEAIDCGVDLISDVFKSGLKENAKQMVFEAISRMYTSSLSLRQTLENSGQNQKQVSSSSSSSNKRKKKQLQKQKEAPPKNENVPFVVKGANKTESGSIAVPVHVARMVSMFVRLRQILGAEFFPNVYRMVLSLIKDHNVDLLMGIYTQSLVDNVSSDTFKDIVVSCLGKKFGFKMAMQILEEMQAKITSGNYNLANNFDNYNLAENMDVDDDNESIDDDDDDNNNGMQSLLDAVMKIRGVHD